MDKVKAAKRKEIQLQTGQIRRNYDRLPLETLHRRLVVDKVKAVERSEIHSQTGQIRRNYDRLPLETLHRRLVVDKVTKSSIKP